MRSAGLTGLKSPDTLQPLLTPFGRVGSIVLTPASLVFNRMEAIPEIGLSLFAGLGDPVAPSKVRQDQPHDMAIIVLGRGGGSGAGIVIGDDHDVGSAQVISEPLLPLNLTSYCFP
ncbi:MAG: hypothetical protein ACLP7A_11335 [Desulfobaccales bacterium]